MAETATRSESEETRGVRSRWVGLRGRLSGGLVLLLSGLLLAYFLGVGESVERSSKKMVEASPPIFVSPPAGVLTVELDHSTELNHPTTADETENPAASTSAMPDVVRDRAYRRLLIGKWETERSGHRELTVRPDGTATMVVRLVGLHAAVFGEKLTFWIKWTIQNGKLAFATIGGEPASQIQIVTLMYGTSRTQKIRSLTKDRLLLIDGEGTGSPDHDYRRIDAGKHE